MSLTTSAASTARVTWASAGDVVGIGLARFMLYRQCDVDRGRTFWCATHDQKLANRCQLEMHTDDGADHAIVSWCPRHGFEGPDPAGSNAAPPAGGRPAPGSLPVVNGVETLARDAVQ